MTRRLISAYHILLFLTFSVPAIAQEYSIKVKSIGVEDGLVSRNIGPFFQDAGGLMWMGSSEGMSRYDGYRVKSYTVENGALISDAVRSISEDRKGNLWLLGIDPNRNNDKVFQIFDPRSGKSVIATDFFDSPLPMDVQNLLRIQSDYVSGNLWLTTKDDKVYLYDQPDNSLPSFRLVYEAGKAIYGIKTCPQGIWLSFEGTFRLLDPSGRIIKQVDTGIPGALGILGADDMGNVYYLRELPIVGKPDQKPPVIFVNEHPLGGAAATFWQGKRIMGFDPYHKQSWYLKQGAYGRAVYDGFLNELVEYDLEREIQAFPVPLYFDRSGNGWANFDSRINIIKLEKSPFTNYLTDINVFGLNGYGARGLYVNDQNQLFTNGLGLSYKIDLSSGKKERFSPNTNFYGEKFSRGDTAKAYATLYGGHGDKEELKRLALIPDKKGNLWYTDEGVRLFKYDIRTQEFTDYTYAKDYQERAPGESMIHWSAFSDSKSRLWLGGNVGLAQLDEKDSVIRKIRNYGAFETLGRSSIYTFHENESGIWIGATTGLYLMNPEGRFIKRFHTEGTANERIPFNTIAHIREDKEGFLWLATRGGGIVKLNTFTGEFNQWTTKNGLSDNTVYATYEDDYGCIWVPSNRGIMRIRLDNFSISTYTTADGLIHEEFNTTSHFKAKDGRLFFGSIDGVTSFHPMDFLNELESDIVLKVVGLKKQERKTGLYQESTLDYFTSEQVRLEPNELGFSLEFTLLDFIDSDENTFSYKIEGIDQQWSYVDQPVVRINSLPYGTYTLLVRGQGRQGQWSRELSIPVVVIRPFYLRWWFFTVIGLALISLIWWRVAYREKRLLQRQAVLEEEIASRTVKIRQQAEELQELDALKSKFFANVSHELRTPLSLILGPVNKLISRRDLDQGSRKDLIRIQKNSQQISKLVEEILDLTKLENKKMTARPKLVKLKPFFSRLYNSFESKAAFQNIEFHYSYKGDEHESFHLDPDMTERIINNLLSNAFKFTSENGQIVLRVLSGPDHLQVSVSDDGMGISKQDLPHIFERFFQTKDSKRAASGGTGIGLALSKELAETMNGQLIVQSEIDKGSTFILTLPYMEAAPSVDESVSREVESVKADKRVEKTLGKGDYVLVVEDHPDMRDFIVGSLSEDFATMEAGDGQEALAILKATDHKPTLIITDMMMPELDGMQLLSALKTDEVFQSVPVIMLTARTADEDKLEAFRIGVDDYLIKPFSVEELKARIRNQLKVSESRRVANLVSEVSYEHNNTLADKLENWLLEVKKITQENVHKVDFNIASVAEAMGLSERQFQRNLKKATGYSPSVYLKEIRLQMARNYLEQQQYDQVSEVSLAVGFTSAPYFSRLYKERFGKTPGAYFLEGAV